MRIAVDAMGGDHAPEQIVLGALAAARTVDAEICLVGDEAQLQALLSDGIEAASGGPTAPAGPGRVTVVHEPGVIGMDESPRAALQRGRCSSMAASVELVRDGEAQGAVSVGNSGAFMALATTRLRNIANISRPAIAITVPTSSGKAILLDAGANADCKPEHLAQFATMGIAYAEHLLGLKEPRVATLNIGEEQCKGNALTQATYGLLSTAPINFVGHVEANAMFDGHVDVIVADGFVGNIVLKTIEASIQFFSDGIKTGVARGSVLPRLGAWLMRPVFRSLAVQYDWAEYGGALLLGVNGVCVIGHGRSDWRAVRNAIQVAAEAVEHDIVEQVRQSVQLLSGLPAPAEVMPDSPGMPGNLRL